MKDQITLWDLFCNNTTTQQAQSQGMSVNWWTTVLGPITVRV